MASTSKSSQEESPIDKMLRLYKEGKSYDEIAKECKVCKQTVRNHISDYTGVPKRSYNRTYTNCKTGAKVATKAVSRTTILETEVRDLKTQTSKLKSLYKSSQNQNAKLKTHIVTLEAEKKNAQQENLAKDKEYDKLLKEHAKLKTALQAIKIEGYETPSLRTKLLTNKFKNLEDKNIFLAGRRKDGGVDKVAYIDHID